MTTELLPSPPEGYAAIADAAKIGNVSENTIRNWATRRLIGNRTHKRPGVTPIKVYSIADIQAQVARQQEMTLGPRELAHKATADTLAKMIEAMPARSAAALPTQLLQPQAVPLDKKLWLSADEAVAYSGLGKGRIQELAKDGKVRTEQGPHGSVVFCRTDLERLG